MFATRAQLTVQQVRFHLKPIFHPQTNQPDELALGQIQHTLGI